MSIAVSNALSMDKYSEITLYAMAILAGLHITAMYYISRLPDAVVSFNLLFCLSTQFLLTN